MTGNRLVSKLWMWIPRQFDESTLINVERLGMSFPMATKESAVFLMQPPTLSGASFSCPVSL